MLTDNLRCRYWLTAVSIWANKVPKARLHARLKGMMDDMSHEFVFSCTRTSVCKEFSARLTFFMCSRSVLENFRKLSEILKIVQKVLKRSFRNLRIFSQELLANC